MLEDYLKHQLEKREQDHLLRKLSVASGRIDFVSNDYLGLARSEDLFTRIQQKIENTSHVNGATGSRLLSGNNAYTEEVEHMLTNIFRSEATLIFNSGYSANLAVLSSIPQRGDTILYDELAHASLKDGARLSLANRYSFRHNDLNDLEQKLKRTTGNCFIVTESIYSMDGDACPLAELVNLAEKYNASIVLDEAHSTGVYGDDGSGLAVAQNLQHKIPVRIYTFGKAMGIHGACVAGSKNLVQYLINFARPFIYTTALPPHSIASIACAFDYLKEHINLQAELQSRITLFLSKCKTLSNRTDSKSAIQTIIFPGNENARQAAIFLQQHKFDIRPILSPTVPVGTERLRICLHTFNTATDIKKLGDALKSLPVNVINNS